MVVIHAHHKRIVQLAKIHLV